MRTQLTIRLHVTIDVAECLWAIAAVIYLLMCDPKGYGTAPIERISRRSRVHRPTIRVREPHPVAPTSRPVALVVQDVDGQQGCCRPPAVG
jgi:hypothetical protein